MPLHVFAPHIGFVTCPQLYASTVDQSYRDSGNTRGRQTVSGGRHGTRGYSIEAYAGRSDEYRQARAVYEDTKIFFARTGYRIIDLYATLGEYDFVSIIEVPDQNVVEHLFRRGILAAAHGTFQVTTMPALAFEHFVKVVDEMRPPDGSSREEKLLKETESL